MLYDPKWQKPIDVFSIESFIAWLENQPRDRSYVWTDICGCVAHQYLSAHGSRHIVGRTLGSVFPSISAYHRVCGAEPRTFGAALDRARAERT